MCIGLVDAGGGASDFCSGGIATGGASSPAVLNCFASASAIDLSVVWVVPLVSVTMSGSMSLGFEARSSWWKLVGVSECDSFVSCVSLAVRMACVAACAAA